MAAKQGFAKAAKDLGVYESQLYDWRTKLSRKARTSQREAELAAEIVKLKRQLYPESLVMPASPLR